MVICETKNMTKVKNVEPKINGYMAIGEILEVLPEAREILTSYGLHCVGCHANIYETLEAGTMGHGMPKETYSKLLEELNLVGNRINDEELSFTDEASKQINDLIKRENKKALKIKILEGGCAGFSYDFSIVDKKESGDIEILKNNVKVYVNKENFAKIKGSRIDFVVGLQGAGIKIDNPNAKANCGCGNSFA